jgi:hypothetical protein
VTRLLEHSRRRWKVDAARIRIRGKTVWLSGTALLFSLALAPLTLAAQEAPKPLCPATVQLTEPKLAMPVAGWNVTFDTAPHRLSRVTLFDGPVEENASLVPDRVVPEKETTSGKTRTAKWLLQPKPERPYWLACYYSGSSLALSRALPAGLKMCSVTYSLTVEIDGMPEIQSLSCR